MYTRASFYYDWILSKIGNTSYQYKFVDKFIKVNDVFPYGTSFGDSILSKADDSTFLIYLNYNFKYLK